MLTRTLLPATNYLIECSQLDFDSHDNGDSAELVWQVAQILLYARSNKVSRCQENGHLRFDEKKLYF